MHHRRPVLSALRRRSFGLVAAGAGSGTVSAMTIAAAPARAGDPDIAAVAAFTQAPTKGKDNKP